MHGWEGFSVNWSSDSRWFTYVRDLDNYHRAAYIYDAPNKTAAGDRWLITPAASPL